MTAQSTPAQIKYPSVMIATDIMMSMNYNAELCTRALVAVISFACRSVATCPNEGLILQCTFHNILPSTADMDGSLRVEDLVEYLAENYMPEDCCPTFTETFCACTMGRVCRTCQAAEEKMELYKAILWDIMTRTIIPFHALPKNYVGGMGVDPIGPDTVMVKFV
ncbi:hypothetical protein [Vibrio phage vB_pir03]|nr:hypothetical protein [Vibrio phage vB_pir03]